MKEIIEERTFFDAVLHVPTGNVLQEEDGSLFYMDGDEKVIVDDPQQWIEVEFNNDVYDNFIKFYRRILSDRGVKDVTTIDENDYTVRRIIKNRISSKSKGARGKNRVRSLAPNEISQIVTKVIRVHQPYNTLIFFQLLLWAMVRDDFFSFDGNDNLTTRFEGIVVPEDYWQGKVKDDDPWEKMLDNAEIEEIMPYINRDDPLEIAVALVSAFINDNPELADALQPYLRKGFAGITYLTNIDNYDDAGFLTAELDELLFE